MDEVVTYQPPDWALLMCFILGTLSVTTNFISFLHALKVSQTETSLNLCCNFIKSTFQFRYSYNEACRHVANIDIWA